MGLAAAACGVGREGGRTGVKDDSQVARVADTALHERTHLGLIKRPVVVVRSGFGRLVYRLWRKLSFLSYERSAGSFDDASIQQEGLMCMMRENSLEVLMYRIHPLHHHLSPQV